MYFAKNYKINDYLYSESFQKNWNSFLVMSLAWKSKLLLPKPKLSGIFLVSRCPAPC